MAYKYIFLDHTADVAVDVEAHSLNELFTAAGLAWRESIYDGKIYHQFENKSIILSEESLEILLVTFLSELNFIFQSESWMMNSIKYIEIGKEDDGWTLSVKILGGNFNRNELRLKTEIKAITYHQMEIKEKDGKFSTRIVFDI